jgi:DNA polymerase III epsilon subunit-like protein
MSPELVFFDVETTSAKPSTCAVVQLGALHVYFNPALEDVEEKVLYDEICDPGMDCHHGAEEVHGITAEMMQGKRPDYEVLAEFYGRLEALCAAGAPVIVAGHAVSTFDLPILYRLAGKPALPVQVIDTLVIARRVLTQSPDGKLGSVYTWITGNDPVDAHDALGDCKMVKTIVEYLCKALKKDLLELAAYCAEPRVLKYCTFGRHKGKLWGRGGKEFVPPSFVRWMCENFDGPVSPDLIVTMKHHYGMRFRNA